MRILLVKDRKSLDRMRGVALTEVFQKVVAGLNYFLLDHLYLVAVARSEHRLGEKVENRFPKGLAAFIKELDVGCEHDADKRNQIMFFTVSTLCGR